MTFLHNYFGIFLMAPSPQKQRKKRSRAATVRERKEPGADATGSEKRGRGRPKKYDEPLARATVNMPAALLARLDEWASARSLSRSEAMVAAAEKLLG